MKTEKFLYKLTATMSVKTFYVLRDMHLTSGTQNLPKRWVVLDTVLNTQYPELSKEMDA